MEWLAQQIRNKYDSFTNATPVTNKLTQVDFWDKGENERQRQTFNDINAQRQNEYASRDSQRQEYLQANPFPDPRHPLSTQIIQSLRPSTVIPNVTENIAGMFQPGYVRPLNENEQEYSRLRQDARERQLRRDEILNQSGLYGGRQQFLPRMEMHRYAMPIYVDPSQQAGSRER